MIDVLVDGKFIEIVMFYWLFVYFTKQLAYKYINRYRDIRKLESNSFTFMVISPDFWLSKYFKIQISQNEPSKKGKLIELYNQVNLSLSVFIFCSLIVVSSRWGIYDFMKKLVVLRCVSRSLEIAYAFLIDVIYEKTSTSGLDKFQRIRLALSSYVEIYFLYASLYFVRDIPQAPILGGVEALVKSFSVGTFTNVSEALVCKSPVFSLLVYGQIFTTLILVLMSLAIYVGRGE
ncbi:TPA: hypothetical protein ACRZ2U_005131 [Vibrio harveyi]